MCNLRKSVCTYFLQLQPAPPLLRAKSPTDGQLAEAESEELLQALITEEDGGLVQGVLSHVHTLLHHNR